MIGSRRTKMALLVGVMIVLIGVLPNPAFALNQSSNWSFTGNSNQWTSGTGANGTYTAVCGTNTTTTGNVFESFAYDAGTVNSFKANENNTANQRVEGGNLSQLFTVPGTGSQLVRGEFDFSAWGTIWSPNTNSSWVRLDVYDSANTTFVGTLACKSFNSNQSTTTVGFDKQLALTGGTTYRIRVSIAIENNNTNGAQSVWVDKVVVTTPPVGTAIVSQTATTTPKLTWTASTATSTALSINATTPYKIYRDTTGAGNVFLANGTTTSYYDTSAVGDTTYNYWITNLDTSSYESASSTQLTILTLPGKPGTPTASNITVSGADLTWSAPNGGAASYKIERCTGSGCTSSFTELATGISSPYTDSTGSASTVYRYRIRATNATGDGEYSALSADVTTAAPTTILGDGSVVNDATIGPGAAMTQIDRFSLATDAGVDTVNALTVTLGPANAYTNTLMVTIVTMGLTVKCSITPTSNVVNLSSCGISVNTTPTEYRVMITPKSHANMAPPATGVSYDTTATVTSFTSTNGQSGTDSSSATLTIDNLSPANVASATVTANDTFNSLAWTNPADADLSNIIVVASTSAITFVPTEGSSYSTSTLAGGSRIACSGFQTSCSDTSLTNGTAYYYKIFAVDSRGNWSDAGVTPTGSPATPFSSTPPALSIESYRFRNDNGSESAATYIADESTSVSTNIVPGDRFRLRFLVSNSGGAATNYSYQLEVASTSCSSWYAVPSYGTNVNEHWTMDYSPYVYNGQPTTDLAGLANPPASTFYPGYVQTSANQTSAFTIPASYFSELEYSIKSTIYAAIGTVYCFRVTNAGSTTNFTYVVTPSVTLSATSIRGVNGGLDLESSINGVLRGGGGTTGGSGNAGGEGSGGGTPVGGGGSGGGGSSE